MTNGSEIEVMLHLTSFKCFSRDTLNIAEISELPLGGKEENEKEPTKVAVTRQKCSPNGHSALGNE